MPEIGPIAGQSGVQSSVAPAIRVMIVEDDSIVVSYLSEVLPRLGYAIVGIADSGEAALAQIAQLLPDVVLMEIQIRGSMDGIETAKRVPDHLGISVIFLSSHCDDLTIARAGGAKPSGFLIKPVQERLLHANITAAVARSRANRPRGRQQKRAVPKEQLAFEYSIPSPEVHTDLSDPSTDLRASDPPK